MAKQPYNNRGWIEWREPETSPDFAEVSPKVFREMKQRYEDEGKSVSISGDCFYGAVLVVDNVKMAKRIKPEVWEPCGPTEHNQWAAKNKEQEEAKIAEANAPKPIYCLGNKNNWLFYCPIAAIFGFIFHPLVCTVLMIGGVLSGLLLACVQSFFGLILAFMGIDYGDVRFPDIIDALNLIAEYRCASAILVSIVCYFMLQILNTKINKNKIHG